MMTYEEFKKLAKSFFDYYGVEMEFLKTGTANPKYRLTVKGYKVKRIEEEWEFNSLLHSRAYANSFKIPTIPTEIQRVAYEVIMGEGTTNTRGPYLFGKEGLSGTDWVGWHSIRLTTKDWENFAKKMTDIVNVKKNIALVESL